MKGTDILSIADTLEWLHIDYTDPTIEGLIQIAYDVSEGAINDFEAKLKSVKFKRKLKMLMLNTIVNMYDDRKLIADTHAFKDEKLSYVNQTMLLQLQLGTYLESDI